MPVHGLDGLADLDVSGGVLGAFDQCLQRGWCRADSGGGLLLGVGGVERPSLEVGEVDGLGEQIDLRGVRIVGRGKQLRSGAAEPAGEVLVDVEFVVGVHESPVVLVEVAIEAFDLASGGDEPVLVAPAGEKQVARLPVEALDTDADRDIPRPSLGTVAGERVAVVDAAGSDVVVAERDEFVGAVEPHDEPVSVRPQPRYRSGR